MKITKTLCKETAAKADGQPRWVWDDEVKGFGLRVHPSKRIAYVLRYRMKGETNPRTLTLGWYPDTDVAAARDEARRIKTAAVLGQDVIGEARAEQTKKKVEETKASYPVAALLDSWREAQEAELRAKEAEGQSILYERELLRLERAILRPAIGGKTVTDIAPDFFQAFLDLQLSVSTRRNLRNLVVRLSRHANARMTVLGLPTRWPVSFTLPRTARPSREHLYTLEEAARMWIAAGKMGRRGALVRLMLLTGCRRIEAQKAQWGHLIFDDPILGSYWQQPGRLTKNHRPHRVPLSPVAVNLLRWLPHFEGTDLLFPGHRKRKGGQGLIGGWTDIRRTVLTEAEVGDGTLHDFRRTIVSILGDRGVDPVVVDKLLNHSAGATLSGVMGVYQRADFWEQRVRAVQTWTDLLMAEVERIREKPWAFDEPFQEARIVRPKRAA